MAHEDYKFFNRQTDVAYTKKVQVAGKQPFTNIDTYYLIQEATKEFGLFGTGWGFETTDYREAQYGDTTLLILTAVIFYKRGDNIGRIAITNSLKMVYKTKSGYLMIDEDAFKKLETNTIAKALSRIGFGTDVYMGLFEDEAYMAEALYDAVQMIQPNQVQTLLKGITYYKADKDEILRHFGIGHLKELPVAKMQEAEALIKKIGTRDNETNS